VKKQLPPDAATLAAAARRSSRKPAAATRRTSRKPAAAVDTAPSPSALDTEPPHARSHHPRRLGHHLLAPPHLRSYREKEREEKWKKIIVVDMGTKKKKSSGRKYNKIWIVVDINDRFIV
jgi:hypothetical protein